MLRNWIPSLFFALALVAIPASAQSSTPVPPPAASTHEALPRAHVSAQILGRISPADRRILSQAWLLSVRQKLLMSWRPLLPSAARAPMGQAGTAVLVVELGPDGITHHVRVERSTGDKALLTAAQGAVKSSSPYPVFPPGVAARSIRLRIAFQYD